MKKDGFLVDFPPFLWVPSALRAAFPVRGRLCVFRQSNHPGKVPGSAVKPASWQPCSSGLAVDASLRLSLIVLCLAKPRPACYHGQQRGNGIADAQFSRH